MQDEKLVNLTLDEIALRAKFKALRIAIAQEHSTEHLLSLLMDVEHYVERSILR